MDEARKALFEEASVIDTQERLKLLHIHQGSTQLEGQQEAQYGILWAWEADSRCLKMAPPWPFTTNPSTKPGKVTSETHFGDIRSRRVSTGRPLRSMVDSIPKHHNSNS